MDPASALGIISSTFDIASRLKNYYDGVRHADDSVEALYSQLSGFEYMLRVVETTLKSRQLDDCILNKIESRVLDNKNALDKFKEKLGKVQPDASKDGARVMVSSKTWKMQYPFRESTLWKLRENVQRLQSQLYEALMLIQSGFQTDVMQNGFEHLSLGLKSVANDIMCLKDDHERTAILDWLTVTDPSRNQQAASRKREPGTGDWIFETSSFSTWQATPGSVIWLYGKPGCGKTVLCSTVVETLQNHCGSLPLTQLAYYYFSFSEKDKQTLDNCIGSLVSQLCQGQQIPKQLRSLFARCSPNSPDLQELKHILIDLVCSEGRQTFLVFDALDECPGEDDKRKEILDWLVELQSSSLSNTHIMVFSRDIADIRDCMTGSLYGTDVGIADAQIQGDIQRYLRSQLKQDAKLNRTLTPVLRDTIVETLTAKANGMFRWVYCQLERLKRLHLGRPKDIKRVLNTLPQSLDETYERILREIPSDVRDVAINALRWIAFSRGSLYLQQIAEGCIVNVSEESTVDEDDRFEPERLFILLSSLIVREHESESGTKVRLAHFSVLEYLESSRILECQDSAVSRFHLDGDRSHSMIAHICLRYISYCADMSEVNNQQSQSELFPLLWYAICEWDYHYSKTSSIKAELLFQQMIESEDSFSAMTQIYLPDDIHRRGRDQPGSPLYYATFLGLRRCVASLLSHDCELNTEGGIYHTALQAAAHQGHTDLFEGLLEAGADAHKVGGRAWCAMAAASASGMETQVEKLLTLGIPANQARNSSLCCATTEGYKGIVEKLLDAGADVNEKHPELGTPFSAGARGGNLEIMQLLATRGAMINEEPADSSGVRHCIALIDAISNKPQALSIVTWLIEQGANVNSTNGVTTALTLAVHVVHWDIFLALLEAKADPNMYPSISPLEAAIQQGLPSFADKLQDYGAILPGHEEQKKIFGGQRPLVANLVRSGPLYHIVDDMGRLLDTSL